MHVAQPVSRPDVIEISAITKHVGQHAKRGLLAGAVVGAVLGAASAASYTGNEGYDNVPAMAFVGAGDKDSVAEIRSLQARFGEDWTGEWLAMRGVVPPAPQAA